MKYIAKRIAMRPRSALFLAALLMAVSAFTLRTDGETKAQTGSLPAPDLTASSIGGNAIEVNWSSVSGAVRYELMTRSAGSAGWVELESSLTVTIYRHTNLSSGATYQYIVRGVAADGTEGAWSESASATVSGILAPPATATPTSTAISIRSSRNGVPIPGGGSYGSARPPYAPPLVDDVSPTVTPTPTSGLTSTPTATPTATMVVLEMPVMTATATERGIELSWEAVAGALRYELVTWWDAEISWQRIGGDNLTGTSYTHGDVVAGTVYVYSIRAVGRVGEGSYWGNYMYATALGATGAATSTPTATPTPAETATPAATASARSVPSVPDLTAVAKVEGVELTWEAVTHAVRYELLTWWDDENGWQRIGGDNLTGTTYMHTEAVAGTKYYYSIRAVNSAGETSGWLMEYPTATALAAAAATDTVVPANLGQGAVVAL